jgi:hypothetical protein
VIKGTYKTLLDSSMRLRAKVRDLQQSFNQNVLQLDTKPQSYQMGDRFWWSGNEPQFCTVTKLFAPSNRKILLFAVFLFFTLTGCYVLAPKDDDKILSFAKNQKGKSYCISNKEQLKFMSPPALANMMGRIHAVRGDELAGVMNWKYVFETVSGDF